MEPDSRTTITMRVRVPVYVCSLCGAREQSTVHEARSWQMHGAARRPDDDAQLTCSSWNTPDGWWSIKVPTLGDVVGCRRCGDRLAAGLAALVERLKAERGAGNG